LTVLMSLVVVDMSSSSSLGSSSSSEAQKQYFWLYNVQSKGPKCQPAVGQFLTASSDPHVLSHVYDPVTDVSSCTSPKHCGRQRDQSATDTVANPRLLLQIGSELQRLTAVINAPPTADISLSARDKNKFASRICRLKRKAQHEANKIKLHGLEQEHCKTSMIFISICF